MIIRSAGIYASTFFSSVPKLVANTDGSENPKYFNQDMEFDAYAFAYAVMKYKYGEISYLYKPTAYGNEFDETVEDWCKAFKSEGL